MKLTGVGGVFCAAHVAKEGGAVHGHTFQVIVWMDHCNAIEAKARLNDFLTKHLDHRTLEWPTFAHSEDVAEYIGTNLRPPTGVQVHSVEVNRPMEHIYAKWINMGHEE